MKRLCLPIAAALLLLGVASSAGVWDIPSGTANAGVIISATGGGGASYTDYTNDANIVSWWEFDNDATDSQGSNDLTANNTPTYSTGTKIQGTHAALLDDASSQYFSIAPGATGVMGHDSSGSASNTDDYSFGFWFRADDISADMGIIGIIDSSDSSSSWGVVYDQSDGDLTRYLTANGWLDDFLDTNLPSGGVSANQWYFVVYVMDSSGNMHLWVGTDSSAVVEYDDSSYWQGGGYYKSAGEDLRIGWVQETPGGYFSGYIDEAFCFSDALTENEMNEIRQHGIKGDR